LYAHKYTTAVTVHGLLGMSISEPVLPGFLLDWHQRWHHLRQATV